MTNMPAGFFQLPSLRMAVLRAKETPAGCIPARYHPDLHSYHYKDKQKQLKESAHYYRLLPDNHH